MKFFDYINDRGDRVVLQGIDQPPTDFKSPTDILERILEHEKKVTSRINYIYSGAVQENDYASLHFLSWFVAEQIEEEKNATQILERLRLAGVQGNALFMIDSILGRRGELSSRINMVELTTI
jgi:ferritin